MDITFITSNPGKVIEVSKYLDIQIENKSLDLEEIQSLDLEEIVKDKVLRAFNQIKSPVLVEDVSFTFHALGNLPGPLIKWFLKELGNDGLCHLVDGKNRSCTATVCYGLYDGNQIQTFSGSMKGRVADVPRGDGSFGWAPIFIPEGYNETYAELSIEEQVKFSMRNKALKKLKEYLR
jgi:non-canonical purine NTP pyrophosphatase (RdgB/HAM1 family)